MASGHGTGRAAQWTLSVTILAAAACSVSERCYSNASCTPPKICLLREGECGYECSRNQDCGGPLRCVERRCMTRAQASHAQGKANPSAQRITCPDDMVNVGDSFCIDRYEASRPDATKTDEGSDESRATSRRGVLPWTVAGDNDQARAACVAAGKDLCTKLEWRLACQGSEARAYGYGSSYQEQTCNGIDLFGPGRHKLLPTGSLSGCHCDYGANDMNGNLWEHVRGGTGATVRGGAYDCIDSERLHRCDYVPLNWTPLSIGFRCCLNPGRQRAGA